VQRHQIEQHFFRVLQTLRFDRVSQEIQCQVEIRKNNENLFENHQKNQKNVVFYYQMVFQVAKNIRQKNYDITQKIQGH
jgi:hypothetical protein